MKPLEVVILPRGVDWRFDFQQRLAKKAFGPGSLMEQGVDLRQLPKKMIVRPGAFVPCTFVVCDVTGRKELFRAPLVHDSGGCYRASGVCRASGEVGECYAEGFDVAESRDAQYVIKLEGLPKFVDSGEKFSVQVSVP